MPKYRAPQAIQADIDETEAGMSRIKRDLDAVYVRMDGMQDGEVPDNIQRNTDRLVAGFDRKREQLTELRSELRGAVQRGGRIEALRSKAGDARNLEHTDGPAIRRSDRYDRRPDGGDVVRSNALRMLDDLGAHDEVGRHILTPSAGDHLDGLIRRSDDQVDGSYIARRMMITESDVYRSAFQKYIAAGGRQMFLTAEESDAVARLSDLENEPIYRAMSENTGSAGAFGVPVLVDSTIQLTSGASDVPMLRICRVEQVTSNLWTGVSSLPMAWSYTTEGTEASDNSPTLAQPSVRVHMPKGFLPYSVEVSQDYPNFAVEFGRLIDQGYNDLLATKTMTGSGTNEPFGIFVALSNATSVITPTTDGSFGGEDIFKIWNSLGERFRSRATWCMSVSVQSRIRMFAASQAATSAFFTIDLTGGEFRLNDRPVVLTDYAPGFSGAVPGTTGLANILAVGDFHSAYTFVQRAGMSVETIPMLTGSSSRFPTGQRGLWGWARNGANVTVTQAARLLQNQ